VRIETYLKSFALNTLDNNIKRHHMICWVEVEMGAVRSCDDCKRRRCLGEKKKKKQEKWRGFEKS